MLIRKHLIYFIFFGIATLNIQAQNLIQNPGFEEWDGNAGSPPNTLAPLTHWYEANGTPDHHHVGNNPGSNLTGLEDCPLGEGNTWCGTALEGEGVLGCWKGNGPDGSREWGGIELAEPMVAGGCYKVSFWIQNKKDKVGAEFVSNQWGVFFNHTEIPFFNPNLANYAAMSDHWVACEEVIDGSEWRYLEWDYQASEDFNYMYIGYMGDFSTSTYSVPNDNYLLGYYVWIDSISVVRIDPQLDLTEDMTICQGESVTLEATSNFPIIWEDDNSGVPSRIVSPEHSTTYYIQTLDSTLCSVRDSIVVTVIGDEVINFSGVTICDGAAPLILEPSITTGSWSGPGIINAAEGLFDPSVTGVGDHYVTYNSGADCSDNFTMFVQVVPPPEIILEADTLSGCPPLIVEFNEIGPLSGISYSWDFGNGTFSDMPLMASATYADQGSYDITVHVVYSENCQNSETFEDFIEVFEAPVADFDFSPNSPSNLSPDVEFTDISSGVITEWQWAFGNGDTSDKSSTTASFEMPGIYDVSLQVTSIDGCQDSISRQVTVKSIVNFYVPNAFSPNDDGINDLFEIYTIGPLQEYKITIFDRWGGMVFQSKSLNDPWDGDFFNGTKADVGVYTYVIEYKYQGVSPGQSFSGTESGDVIILR
ncbi:MAG: PKD domain-containing protein [Bacteroidetes bacterium]|nr:MAG: PKD domain-containing protein [Bacteroidota bacterium]